jgi:hypothetical protein
VNRYFFHLEFRESNYLLLVQLTLLSRYSSAIDNTNQCFCSSSHRLSLGWIFKRKLDNLWREPKWLGLSLACQILGKGRTDKKWFLEQKKIKQKDV